MNIMRYYGIDFVAMLLSALAPVLLGNKSRIGFAMAMAGNVMWFLIAVSIMSYGMMLANCFIFSANMRGFLIWSK